MEQMEGDKHSKSVCINNEVYVCDEEGVSKYSIADKAWQRMSFHDGLYHNIGSNQNFVYVHSTKAFIS